MCNNIIMPTKRGVYCDINTMILHAGWWQAMDESPKVAKQTSQSVPKRGTVTSDDVDIKSSPPAVSTAAVTLSAGEDDIY